MSISLHTSHWLNGLQPPAVKTLRTPSFKSQESSAEIPLFTRSTEHILKKRIFKTFLSFFQIFALSTCVFLNILPSTAPVKLQLEFYARIYICSPNQVYFYFQTTIFRFEKSTSKPINCMQLLLASRNSTRRPQSSLGLQPRRVWLKYRPSQRDARASQYQFCLRVKRVNFSGRAWPHFTSPSPSTHLFVHSLHIYTRGNNVFAHTVVPRLKLNLVSRVVVYVHFMKCARAFVNNKNSFLFF